MSEVRKFKDVAWVFGEANDKVIYDADDQRLFTFNPKEWKLDITLTRRKPLFVPGYFADFSVAGDVVKTVTWVTTDPSSWGGDWRRVTVEEA